jgi:predicted transcriptional regulator
MEAEHRIPDGVLLSPKHLELLETIANHEPDSIRESAQLVDRDYTVRRKRC